MVGAGKEFLQTRAATRTEIQGEVIDIHADKFVGTFFVHASAQGEGMTNTGLPVVESVMDTFPKGCGDGVNHGRTETAPDNISTQGQREAAGVLSPPRTQILTKGESLLGIGELAFVNDDARVDTTGKDFGLNLIEGEIDSLKRSVREAEIKLQREIGAGEESGDTNPHRFHRFPPDFLFCDKAGSVAIAKTGPTGEEGVGVGQGGVGMKRNRGKVELPRLATTI